MIASSKKANPSSLDLFGKQTFLIVFDDSFDQKFESVYSLTDECFKLKSVATLTFFWPPLFFLEFWYQLTLGNQPFWYKTTLIYWICFTVPCEKLFALFRTVPSLLMNSKPRKPNKIIPKSFMRWDFPLAVESRNLVSSEKVNNLKTIPLQ